MNPHARTPVGGCGCCGARREDDCDCVGPRCSSCYTCEAHGEHRDGCELLEPEPDVDDRIAESCVVEASDRREAIQTAFARRLRRLRERLADLQDMAEERHDTVDRADGTVGPNDWMEVSRILHEALCELEGKAPW